MAKNGKRPIRTWLRRATFLGALAGAVVLASPAHAAVVAQAAKPAPWFDGDVRTVAYKGNTVFIGGSFSNAIVNGKKFARTRLAAVDATTGALLNWAPTADATVETIAIDGNTVYVAGAFSKINGVTRDSVAGIDATTGVLTAFKHSVLGAPYAMAAGNGRLYLAGRLTAVDGAARANAAAFTLATGALDAGWAPKTDDRVEALALTAGRVYLGGMFRDVNGAGSTRKVAAVTPDTGAVIPTFKSPTDVLVRDVTVGANGLVYLALGGQGGRAMAVDATGLAKWTLTTDGDVQAVVYLDSTVYIGGHYDRVCKSANTGDHGVCLDGNTPRVKLAAADATTGDLLGWDPRANGIEGVSALDANPTLHRLAVGGTFTTMGGVNQKRFAMFG